MILPAMKGYLPIKMIWNKEQGVWECEVCNQCFEDDESWNFEE